MKVLIVVPPFASLDYPSLDASVLKRAFSDEGHDAKVSYLNKAFASILGPQAYSEIAEIPPTYGAAEWVGIGQISPELFPESNTRLRKFYEFRHFLDVECQLREETVVRLELAKKLITNFASENKFIKACQSADLILVCCRHQQLGFAARLGQVWSQENVKATSYLFGPQINTLEQASEVTKQFQHYSGVVYQMNALLLAQNTDLMIEEGKLPGVYNKSWANDELSREFETRNLSASPDFTDFFEPEHKGTYSVLPFQMSHGCWWAEKSHCKFCGLVKKGERYLSLTSFEAQDSLRRAIRDHEILHVVFADHLLDTRKNLDGLEFQVFRETDATFFCELKANTPKRKLEELASLGMTSAEFGIESLDNRTLKYIGKGSTVFQNICALKWSIEIGFSALWSWLIGFECEDANSLSKQIDLAKKLTHLPPPLHVTRVRLERRSPFFEDPKAHGMSQIAPQEAFLHTFPLSSEALNKISNYFDYVSTDSEIEFSKQIENFRTLVDEWKKRWRPNLLYSLKGGEFVKIFDARKATEEGSSNAQEIVLRGWRFFVFEALENPTTFKKLLTIAVSRGSEAGEEGLQLFLTELCKLDLVLNEGDLWLSIVPKGNTKFLAWERKHTNENR